MKRIYDITNKAISLSFFAVLGWLCGGLFMSVIFIICWWVTHDQI